MENREWETCSPNLLTAKQNWVTCQEWDISEAKQVPGKVLKMPCNSYVRKNDGLSLLVKFRDCFDYVLFCVILSSTCN